MHTLEDAMAEWLEAHENGASPDVEDYLRRHSHLAKELRPWLEEFRHFQENFPTLPASSPDELSLTELRFDPEDYEVYEKIGGGGQADVYRAKHVGLDIFVALKILRERDFTDEERERHRGDAQALAKVSHSNVVQVYGTGEYAGIPFFSLEYLDGGSLADKLRDRAMIPRDAASLVAKLARAMHYVHQKDILHRDLKPANVLLTSEGEPKITDFGLAKRLDEETVTQAEAFVGTVSYASPEATRTDSKLDERSDVYGLGTILYECLTGRPPFKGADVIETIRQVRETEPVPPRINQPNVPRDLETICMNCLEKDPGNRYANAQKLAEDLERFLNGESIKARRRSWLWSIIIPGRFINPYEWGKISLCGALFSVVQHSIFYLLVRTEQPREVFWCVMILSCLLAAMIFFVNVPAAFRDLDFAEKIVLVLWTGVTLAVLALWVGLGCPIDRELFTTWYRCVAVIMGVGFFLHGLLSWGYHYLIGIAFMGLAIVMRFTPAHWAPFEYVALYCPTIGSVGLYLIRYSKTADGTVPLKKDHNIAEQPTTAV